MNKLLLLINKPIGRDVFIDLLNFHELNIDIVGVVTRPRGDYWWGNDQIIEIAEKVDIPVFNHHKDVDVEFDIAFSVQYDYILEQEFIDKGIIINLHAAELPRYRGCNSTAHVIMNAKKDNYYYAGSTLHLIDKGIDTGKIIRVYRTSFDNETTNRELYKRVTELSYRLYRSFRESLMDGIVVSCTSQSLKIDKDSPSYYYYR
ncbi:unnamed protein product, partial [marine sediment metagenome]